MPNTIDNSVLEKIGVARKPEPKKDELGQTEFLKLMTAQLNNQDPMEPMSSGEFYTQIAQFSAVSGIQDLQKSFTEVANAMFSSQALQASSMVGRDVLVPGSSQSMSAGSGFSGAVDVPAGSPSVILNIHDAAGTLVRRLDLGNRAAGLADFSWDGRDDKGQPLAAGDYEVRSAARIDGVETALGTFLSDRVNSVSIDGGGKGISLNLERQGAVPLSKINQIR